MHENKCPPASEGGAANLSIKERWLIMTELDYSTNKCGIYAETSN